MKNLNAYADGRDFVAKKAVPPKPDLLARIGQVLGAILAVILFGAAMIIAALTLLFIIQQLAQATGIS